MSYVYIKSESAGQRGAVHDMYTVGFYTPSGKWEPESDYLDPEDAAERVAYLNGARVRFVVESQRSTSDADSDWLCL